MNGFCSVKRSLILGNSLDRAVDNLGMALACVLVVGSLVGNLALDTPMGSQLVGHHMEHQGHLHNQGHLRIVLLFRHIHMVALIEADKYHRMLFYVS